MNRARVFVTAAVAAVFLMLAVVLTLFGGGASQTPPTAPGGIALDFKPGEVPTWALGPLVAAASQCPEVTAPFLAAQIEAESKWNPNAESPAGAIGLSQFMPGTWVTWGTDGDGDRIANPRDPFDAIASQAAYMCYLVDFVKARPGLHGGSVLDLALAAYNAGPGNVEEYNGIPPFDETIKYIVKIHHLATTKYGTPATPAAPVPETTVPGAGGVAGAVIDAARSQIGLPYAWGGGTLTGPSGGSAPDVGVVGFDCSSLARYAFYNGSNGSIKLPRTSREQYAATKAHPVQVNQLQPGDLLFWGKSPGSIHHVALYIGNGRMIEAPESGKKIRETAARVTGGDYFGATRVPQLTVVV